MLELNEKQKELFDKLTRLQRGVVSHTLAGMKPADAHREAGGKCTNEKNRRFLGNQILSEPNVKEFFAALDEEVLNDAIMSRHELIERLSILSRVDMNDLITWGYRDVEVLNDDGSKTTERQSFWSLREEVDINDDAHMAIEEVSVDKGALKVKRVSRLSAMKQLADLLGYNADKTVNLNQKVQKADDTEW